MNEPQVVLESNGAADADPASIAVIHVTSDVNPTSRDVVAQSSTCGETLFELLQGPDGLNVVGRRFTQSVEVVRNALEFYKNLAEIEDTYSIAIAKLLRSPCYTFKQSFFQQLMRNENTSELGSLNNGWKQLGDELQKISNHHKEQAANIRDCVRSLLEDCLPNLDKSKSELLSQSKVMIRDLLASERQLELDKKQYMRLAEEAERLREQKTKLEQEVFQNAAAAPKLEKATTHMTQACQVAFAQERKYHSSLDSHVKMLANFEEKSAELMKKISQAEIERVDVMKCSFKELARVLSNSAPTYLEGMQRTLLFTDGIDAKQDIMDFMDSHSSLKERLKRPKFEQFCSRLESSSKTDEVNEGDPTASLPSPKPLIAKKPIRPKRDHAAEFFSGIEDTNESTSVKRISVVNTEETAAKVVSDDSGPSSPSFNPFKTPLIPPELVANGQYGEFEDVVGTVETPVVETVDQTDARNENLWIEQKESTFGDSDEDLMAPTGEYGKHKEIGAARSKRDHDDIVDSITSFKKKSHETASASPEVRGGRTREKPKIKPKPNLATPDGLLRALLELSGKNDYYGLLGASQSSDKSELARLRREKTATLHPDRITNGEAARKRATEELALLNEVYTDVLVKDKTRRLYNQVVAFRKSYREIPHQSPENLAKATKRFYQLKSELERAHVPENLIKEMTMATDTAQAYRQFKQSRQP